MNPYPKCHSCGSETEFKTAEMIQLLQYFGSPIDRINNPKTCELYGDRRCKAKSYNIDQYERCMERMKAACSGQGPREDFLKPWEMN